MTEREKIDHLSNQYKKLAPDDHDYIDNLTSSLVNLPPPSFPDNTVQNETNTEGEKNGK